MPCEPSTISRWRRTGIASLRTSPTSDAPLMQTRCNHANVQALHCSGEEAAVGSSLSDPSINFCVSFEFRSIHSCTERRILDSTLGDTSSRNSLRALVSAMNQRSSSSGAFRIGWISMANRSSYRVVPSTIGSSARWPRSLASTCSISSRTMRPRRNSWRYRSSDR